MSDFVLLLITKEIIQAKTIVMIFPEIDEATWTGEMQEDSYVYSIEVVCPRKC